MRFLRLRIANFRGIAASEIAFSPVGITVVQGPNEVGKTSFSEAIGLLFEFLDSSQHRSVQVVRPVHWDKGPEIELQAESGPYAFTYFKRFDRKGETRLAISRPKPENFTGRKAHERAEEILRETLDIDLWRALTVQQGDAIHQPVLSSQTSLSSALDKAAGGRPADPREEGLFDKVRQEYDQYFTDRGAERRDLQESRKLQTDAQAEVAEVGQKIRELDQDIERAASLQRELGQLKTKEDELEKLVLEYAASLNEISDLENNLTAARLKLESAQKSEEAARRDKEERQRLINAVAEASRAHEECNKSTGMALAALSHAEEELKKAHVLAQQSEAKRKEADILEQLRRADFDYYNNRLNLDQLSERKKRIEQARTLAAQAEEVLARNKVDTRVLKKIQGAERELLAVNAQLETGASSVMLRGLAACHLTLDGADFVLGKGEVRTLSIVERSRLTIPKALEVEIIPGSSAEDLSRRVAEARRALERACESAGVSSPDEAQKAFEGRREASRLVDTREEVEKENLRDLTYEQLDRKLIGLRKGVPKYLANRVKEPSIFPDLDSAKKEYASADVAQHKANIEWEHARETEESARTVRDDFRTKHQEAQVTLGLLAKSLVMANTNLDRARESSPDDKLGSRLNVVSHATSSEEANVRSAESAYRAKNPEKAKALAETAKGSLRRTQTDRNTTQTELTEVQTRLKIHGEEGLHEKLHAAQIRLERIDRTNRALFRRAAAAKCLYENMRDERDKARRAYVAPLKEKIESLGRLVFDSSFQVDISDDLQIASRTEKGVTVPFDSLSGGTREQLSIIFRLACSMIVAKDGGTPLILDDALGYTDPDRLRLMGAVLANAAKDCQIVIFTCMPDRYSNVGEATVVSLR
jgi:DNA repair exonuclease SbcCD ATPase subunit